MLALALTLTLATIHLPPPSSLQLIESQPAQSERLLQIDRELSGITTRWPTGSVVLMAVGFGSTVAFSLGGLLVTIAMGGGLPGAFFLSVALLAGGLSLVLGLTAVIWGAVQSGANRNRIRRLEEEREALLRPAAGLPELVRPHLFTLATF